jgi:putative pyoverdin transport system ATP-binding/permease protein
MRDMWRLFRFVLQPSPETPARRGAMLLILLTGAVGGATSTGLLILLNRVMSQGLAASLLYGFLGLCLVLPVARYVSQILLIQVSQSTMLDLRMRLCRRVLATPLPRLEELGPHRVLATLTEDVANVREIATLIPLLCMHLAVLVGCLLYLAWLSWQMLLAVLLFTVVGVVTYAFAVRRASVYFRRVREGADRLQYQFRGLTDGAKELRLHRNRRAAFLARLKGTAVEMQENGTEASRIYAAAGSVAQTLAFGAIGLLLVLHQTQGMFAVAALTGAVLVILYARTPLDVILQMMPTFNRAGVSLDKIRNLGLSLGPAAAGDAALEPAPEPPPAWESLRLAGVVHSYRRENEDEDSRFVLGPIDLAFRPGELVFLIGGNGSGKTTLAKIILGLYPPEAGEILLDGEPVTAENRDTYSQRFSAVFSDFHLFDFLLGMEDRPDLDEQARHYLTALHLDRKVRIEKGELSTTALSQGQRKRLALLTAYLEDRPIYLFDEWAADQDPYFKEIFYLEILPQLKARGKTVLVISHDDRYYSVPDRIVKIENGILSYDGPETGYAASEPAPARILGGAR